MILTNYAIKLRTAVMAFTAAFVFLGALSYFNMPREGAPDVVIPYVFVTAPYEGVSPTEIENLITIPLEKQFNDLENVKKVQSTSSEGVSVMVIEFLPEEDIDNALQRVKDKIDLARPNLPRDLDEPVVSVINISTDWPILMLALSGDPDTQRLKSAAEGLKDAIEQLGGVKEAAILGAREREIRIETDPAKLSLNRVSLDRLCQVIAGENKTLSAGNLEVAEGKIQVRVPGEFVFPSDMKDLVVAVREGRPVHLRDVATVNDSFKDITSLSRINGDPCVSLIIKKRSGVNTVRLVGEIRKILASYRMPADLRLTTVGDQSTDIRSMVEELENSIFTGFLFVVAVVVIFMGWRNSLFIGASIPLSLLISFPILNAMGLTLNMIVLYALVMSTGMLVDNAIVITENIYRLRCGGLGKIEAARRGAGEVAWPVITSTLTTVVAFLPLLYWPSIIGQFMEYLPKTLIVTLLSSLFVGTVINPAYASLFIAARRNGAPRPGIDGELVSDHPFVRGYEKLLRFALGHPSLVLALAGLFFVFTVLMFGRNSKGVELFPDVEPRRATVQVRYPQGTEISKTDGTIRMIEDKLRRYGDVKFFLSNVGSIGGFGSRVSGTHVGSVEVEFLPMHERSTNSLALVNLIRDDIGLVPGAEIVVDREKEGPPPKPPVSIEIAGDDFDVLMKISDEVIRTVGGVPGLVDLKDDAEEALPEVQFHVDRRRAALLGVSTDFIGNFLRSGIYGSEVSKFRAGEDEYDITVRFPAGRRQSMRLLDETFIPLPDGRSIPLSTLGKYEFTNGRGNIMRKDRKRVVTVTGELKNRSIDAVLRDVLVAVGKVKMPRGYSVSYTGENEDMKESGAFLLSAFGLAVVGIAVILIIQFNSLPVPGIILTSVVMSTVGALWGLMLCGMRFGVIMTGLGIISLAGVVVNNAIVLLDCVRQRREKGIELVEALALAGRLRLRPVLLTAGTTILGLVPMAMGWGIEIHTWPWKIVGGAESSAWWANMAVTVIFGLAFATVLTLVLVPVLYLKTARHADALKRRFAAVTGDD